MLSTVVETGLPSEYIDVINEIGDQILRSNPEGLDISPLPEPDLTRVVDSRRRISQQIVEAYDAVGGFDLEPGQEIADYMKDPGVSAIVLKAPFSPEKLTKLEHCALLGRVALLLTPTLIGNPHGFIRSEYEDRNDYSSVIQPMPGYEDTQGYRGGEVELLPHQEMVQRHEFKHPIEGLAKAVILATAINQPKVPTEVANIPHILGQMGSLAEVGRESIFHARDFDSAITQDIDSFNESLTFPLLVDRLGYTAIDLDVMSSEEERGQQFLSRMLELARENYEGPVADPGQIVVVNNRYAFHGRMPVKEKKSGRRVLQRVYVSPSEEEQARVREALDLAA